MDKFNRKLIGSMFGFVIAAVMIFSFINKKINTNKYISPSDASPEVTFVGSSPEVTAENFPENTDLSENTPSPATQKPVFAGKINNILLKSGDNALSGTEFTINEDLITLCYPYSVNETIIAACQIQFDFENVAESVLFVEDESISGNSDTSAEKTAITTGLTPWQKYTLLLTDSAGITKKYTLKVKADSKKLPVVSIYTDSAIESRTEYVTGKIYISGDGTDYQNLDLDGASMQIRGRGNASWRDTDKKAYRIKLDEKASVLGLPKNRDWVLVSNYFDKSLIRNVVAHSMAQTMENLYYTPTHIMVDLFVNGEYRGVYAICDKIEEAKTKIDLNRGANPDEPAFIIEMGWDYSETYVRDRDYFDTDVLIRFFIKEPDTEECSKDEIKYVQNYIRATEKAIVAGVGYEEYIDVDSFVDWFIIAELTNNTEMAFYRSCYMYKPEGGKLTMGPVWDFDMAFGNHLGDIEDYDGWATAEATYHYVNDTWATYLIKSESFMEKVRTRWIEKKAILLETAYKTIEEQYELVAPSAEENFKLWDILNEQIGMGAVDYHKYNTYELQVQYVKEFITKRAAWIDKQLGVE